MRSRVTLEQFGEEHQHGGDFGYFMIQNIRTRMGEGEPLTDASTFLPYARKRLFLWFLLQSNIRSQTVPFPRSLEIELNATIFVILGDQWICTAAKTAGRVSWIVNLVFTFYIHIQLVRRILTLFQMTRSESTIIEC
jgi:hypothetical protein